VIFVAQPHAVRATGSASGAARRNPLATLDAALQNPPPMFHSPPRRTARAGFTLIEMMVAIAIMAILIGIAAPSLRDFVMNMRLTGQANDLLTDLMLARSEAAKRVTPITVCGRQGSGAPTCGSAADWSQGWLVVIDADSNGAQDAGTTQLKTNDKVGGSNRLTKDSASVITFAPTGVTATGQTTLTLCDSRSKGRVITVNPQGRASITKLESGCV
jgi:type IV fimbrial biogenesis protein FimT